MQGKQFLLQRQKLQPQKLPSILGKQIIFIMTPEDLIQETKETLEFNTKKVEILDKDIEKIKNEATEKINKLQQDRNQIVGQIIKDQGGLEKLEKLINSNSKVESK